MRKSCIGILLILATALLIMPVSVKTANYPPAVMFASLLNNMEYRSDGSFDLGNQMQAVFLPAGTNGYVLLKKADGAGLCKISFTMEAIKPPFTLFSFLEKTNLKTGEHEYAYIKLEEPGNYLLDFYSGDTLFYKFPFSISKVSSSDPYAGGDIYLIDGAWSNWGYLFYSDANPENSITWKMWLNNKGHGEKDIKVRIEVVRDKDKKLVCTSRGDVTYSVLPKWNRFEFDLISPMEGTSGGAYFKAKDLLAVDGAYTLTVKVDDKVYGVWKFSIAGNKLVLTGQADRGKADPITFIEGGKDAFWYKKS